MSHEILGGKTVKDVQFNGDMNEKAKRPVSEFGSEYVTSI